jgi:hypothetical protein
MKLLELFYLDKVMNNTDLTPCAGIVLDLNLVIWPAEAESLNRGFLFLGAADNTAHLGNFINFSLMIAISPF